MSSSKHIRAGSTELRKLQRRFKQGVYLVPQGRGGHAKLCDGDGFIRDERGMPMTIPSSPNKRTMINVEQRLRSLGLLT